MGTGVGISLPVIKDALTRLEGQAAAVMAQLPGCGVLGEALLQIKVNRLTLLLLGDAMHDVSKAGD